MSKEDDKQLTLDLGSPAVKEGKCVDKEPSGSNRPDPKIRSLSELRNAKEKEESAKHFREIIKRARHF